MAADTINYSQGISGESFKIDTTDFVSTNASAVEIDVDQIELVSAANFASTSEITLTVDTITGAKLTNTGNLKLADGIKFESVLENTGTLTCTNAEFANDLALTTSGTFNHTSGTITLSATANSPATLSGSNNFNELIVD